MYERLERRGLGRRRWRPRGEEGADELELSFGLTLTVPSERVSFRHWPIALGSIKYKVAAFVSIYQCPLRRPPIYEVHAHQQLKA